MVEDWFDRVEAQRRLKKLSMTRACVLEYIGILLAEGAPLPPDIVLADLVGVSRSTVAAAKQTGPTEMSDDHKDSIRSEHIVHNIARMMRAAGDSYDLDELRRGLT